MPKQTKLPKARVAPGTFEEGPVLPVYRPLTMEERDHLAGLLQDKVFVKAWKNAELYKPPVFPAQTSDHEGEHGDNRAAKALARIQGWEMHKASLLRQTQEVVPKKKPAKDEYPDSGRLESEVQKSIPSNK